MDEINHRYDDMLFEMLKECKTLPNFFDAILGFLQRRTDFYHIANEPNAVVGLPDGLAEKLLKHSFYKWKPRTHPVPKYEDIPPVAEECVVSSEAISEVTSNTKALNMNYVDFTQSEYYNGAVYNDYCWSQNITDIDINVRIPVNINRKDIKVEILPANISIKLNDDIVLLEGELCQKCKANEAIWSVDNRKLQIHLDKCQEMWWNCLVKSEPKLDISKIDCSRPYEDLSEEAQAKIEELQWNQERKRLGLPTSEEIALHKTLEKAWDAEGSPFKGPFDPSSVQFN